MENTKNHIQGLHDEAEKRYNDSYYRMEKYESEYKSALRFYEQYKSDFEKAKADVELYSGMLDELTTPNKQ